MKVPKSWLKELVSLPPDDKRLTDGLTMIGHMLDKKFKLGDETVFDFELRGNRADCYSLVGIAREVSALFGEKIKLPKTVPLKKVGSLPNFSLVADKRFVRRAGIVEIKNVKIQKSPPWLSQRLNNYGIESVNNIVDLTNYVMIETGEPMHAFDADKIGKRLEIRLAKKGETITTFLGTKLTLTGDDLVWAKGEQILSVAGAIGEKFHSISDGTKNVLLEAANYDRANIRRSVHKHGLLTEAGIRHEKDLDPNMVEEGIGRFLYLLEKNKWGVFKPVMYDFYPKKATSWKIKMNLKRMTELGGLDIGPKKASDVLERLNFKVLRQSDGVFDVLVPTYRTDVTIEEDLIEEVLRIVGYDKIPIKTLSLEIPENITPGFINQEETYRSAAVAVGLDEIISLPFVKKEAGHFNKSDIPNKKVANLVNPPSPDTSELRMSLFPNLFLSVKKIINERGEKACLFEIGKVYSKEKGKYTESRKIGIIFWAKENPGFPTFKGILNGFFRKVQLPLPEFSEYEDFLLKDTFVLRSENKNIGFGGQYDNVFYAEIDLDGLLEKSLKYSLSLWPKYPPQIEDITATLPDKTKVGRVLDLIKNTDKTIQKVDLVDVYKDSYTFRIWYQSSQKTLADEEITKIRRTITKSLTDKFGASLK